MIPFFRKIRKKMADDNKPIKYMRYALGEIVLVVIGILIALQINDWNQHKKNERTEINYLHNILKDIDADIKDLIGLQSLDTIRLNAYTTVLKGFKDEKIRRNLPLFLNAIGNSLTVHWFNGNNIVFEDMKSSGKINLISSDSLRFSILEYYNSSGTLIDSESGTNNPLIIRTKEDIL